MLTSTIKKQGLNREVQAALLRTRTRPECPEGNLRELTWDSNPNCGIARERGKKKEKRERENFPKKSSNLRHCWPAHRTKDWANTRGELAGSRLAHLPPGAERQVGDSQSQKARGKLSPRDGILYQIWAGSQLLTESSWDPERLTSARRVGATRDQFPRGDTRHTWEGTPTLHPGNRAAGTRKVIRCTAPPGESELTKHLVVWAARTWEGHKTQAQLSLSLCGVPENLNLSSLDLGSAYNLGPALDGSPAEQPGAWAV